MPPGFLYSFLLSGKAMSLARKYRPQKFRQLVGQELISKALLQTLKQKNPPQAFLFSGIRGTGKTSLARLYAAALNCQHEAGFEDCDGCPSCKAMGLGNHEDILEIDGASHNSVEDIRRIQETVLYLPQRFSYKVYLIDEVHMLSIQAFNALLKTLEEPPGHVIFLFATTELAKLPATVVGRCQTFHLRRIPQNLITQRIKHILTEEKVSFDDSAIELLAQQGEGSLRDVLSLLDQVVALGEQKAVQRETVEALLDYVPWHTFLPLFKEILQGHLPSMLAQFSALLEQGHEPRLILEKLALSTRNSWILSSLPSGTPELAKLELSPQDTQKLRDSLKNVPPTTFPALFRTLTQTLQNLSGSSVDRYILENTLMEWCLGLKKEDSPQKTSPSKSTTIPAPKIPQPSSPPTQPPTPPHTPPPSVQPKPPITSADFPKSWEELCQEWKKHQPLQATELSFARVQSYSPHHITLVLKDPEASQRLRERSKIQSLQQSLKKYFSFAGTLSILRPEDLTSTPLPYQDLPLSPGEKEQTRRSQEHQLTVTQMEQSSVHQSIKKHFPKAHFTLEETPPSL